ncbi:hypothetical protein H8959_006689 [Pygathrix nigripes]
MCRQKAMVKNADMLEEMQQDSVECATQALEKYNIEKDIAAHIKKEFDKKYNPTWYCIVGRNFGSPKSIMGHRYCAYCAYWISQQP